MSDHGGLSHVLEGIEKLTTKYPRTSATTSGSLRAPDELLTALEQFMEVVRYLNTRRSDTALTLDSEASVQDAVYLMLKPWVPDLVPETPSEKVAGRFVIKDFRSKSLRTIVEAKYVRDKDHGKSLTKELHDDIEMYRNDAHCDRVVFFIYDPNVFIPDQGALRRQIEVDRSYNGRSLWAKLVVKP